MPTPHRLSARRPVTVMPPAGERLRPAAHRLFNLRPHVRMDSHVVWHHCAVNVGEDCPVFDGLYEFCQLSAGGSVGACQLAASATASPRLCPTLVVPRWLVCTCALWRPLTVRKTPNHPLPRHLRRNLACSWCREAQQQAGRHCHQLGGRAAPRQEERGVGLLLRQRHCPGHP